ncbi:MAG TPA: DUF5698 domain-containing protein [Phycisphaerales bacterium]|nr:DUF5698 domain-containing protein [Phycisphaerales bacterium]
MTWIVLGNCLLIILARICDVSLGTLRTVCVINGRKNLAWCLGFCEVLVWVMVVSRVIANLNIPAYAIAYAVGAATGSWVGITVEQRIAFGEQVVRIFSRKGREIAAQLRDKGWRVTEIDGRGRDGHVELLFIEVPRKAAMHVAQIARGLDPQCYFVVDDIRMTSGAMVRHYVPTGWRAATQKK